MARRYLSLALFTEGASDQYFLAPLIDRQIAELSHETHVGFDYSGVVDGGCFTVAHRDVMTREVSDQLRYYDIVMIHHDHNERAKVDAIRDRFPDDAHRIVALVPVRETEAWILADPAALREAAPRSDDSWQIPYDVERIADPKAVLNAALGARRDAERDFGKLGQTVALDALWKVPAYRRWATELRTAMKLLHFL